MVDLQYVLFEVEMVNKGLVQSWSIEVEQGKPYLACQERDSPKPLEPPAYTPEFNVLHAYL